VGDLHTAEASEFIPCNICLSAWKKISCWRPGFGFQGVPLAIKHAQGSRLLVVIDLSHTKKQYLFQYLYVGVTYIYIYIQKKKKKINLKRPVIYNLFPLIVFFVYKRIICTNVVVPLWNQSLGSHVAISIEKRWWQAVMFSLKTNSTRENHKNISQDMKESKLSSIVQKKVFFMLYIFIFIFNFLCRSTSFFLRRTIQINLTQIK
jgi:hypothetical protein